MRYTDRSRTEVDWTCPRARYWEYEHNGVGLAPIETPADLKFGLLIAEAAEAIRRGTPVPPCSMGLPWAALYAGLVEAYRTRIWPVTSSQFEVIALEPEVLIQLAPDVTYMARPDAVVKRLSDQTVWYLEDKTFGTKPESFANGWDKMVQLHATAVAIEHTLGLEVSGAFVQGWYKGYQKTGTCYSALAYAWCKRGQPGVTQDQWSVTYRAGWERRPITEHGVERWVKALPDGVVQDQFPVTPPIPVRRDLVTAYLAQVLRREQQLASGPQNLDLYEQRFLHCDEYSKYRRPCAFRDCCWSPTVGRDPVGSGLYQIRVPHHEAEGQAYEKTPSV